MGLAGGTHCLVMCAAPCHVLTTGQTTNSATDNSTLAAPSCAPIAPIAKARQRLILFHLGRLLGYSAMGALAAFAMEQLAWFTQHAWALRPLWTMSHIVMLAWAVLMMAQARQPLWVEIAGRALWRRVQPLVRGSGGVLGAGFFWAFMPCGLLYSALLVAALSNGPWHGALSMLGFALGSGLWLVAGSFLWVRVRTSPRILGRWRASWGTRLAGALLFAMALWALWLDLVYKPSLWCR